MYISLITRVYTIFCGGYDIGYFDWLKNWYSMGLNAYIQRCSILQLFIDLLMDHGFSREVTNKHFYNAECNFIPVKFLF